MKARRFPGLLLLVLAGACQQALTCVDQAVANRLRVGGVRTEALTACALDLKHTRSVGLHIDGLLGLNFLRSFRVTLDFERNVLHLRDTD